MYTGVNASQPVELCIARPQNRLRIEAHAGNVVIHAGLNNFSPQEKSLLIRYLAAEGFIPQRYEWDADPETAHLTGLTWLVDSSLTTQPKPHRKRLGQITQVILGALLALLVLMTYAFLQAPR
jgi:hypothetical protein